MRRAGVSPDHFTFPFVLKACSRLQTCITVALKVFDEMIDRDLVSWSSVISCFNNNGLPQEALGLFQQMQINGNVNPDEVTMVSVVSAVSSLGDLELGKWVDGIGSVDDCVRVFNEMAERNVLTWTALINGLAVHGRIMVVLLPMAGEFSKALSMNMALNLH
ncbi:pentatricopeptide repeat-containing protein, putative [Ricinus communis]|uniref:Pentatricopeptide repeat-containing protein, putative n=1 Tax=Ricinus communis TaxID=3988 RepID=B9RV69_RICCO|nr:pentatricopeptide repeat-containing protein, putative [Ricinus communis]